MFYFYSHVHVTKPNIVDIMTHVHNMSPYDMLASVQSLNHIHIRQNKEDLASHVSPLHQRIVFFLSQPTCLARAGVAKSCDQNKQPNL